MQYCREKRGEITTEDMRRILREKYNLKSAVMREEYDFTNARKNPYVDKLKNEYPSNSKRGLFLVKNGKKPLEPEGGEEAPFVMQIKDALVDEYDGIYDIRSMKEAMIARGKLQIINESLKNLGV